MLAGWPMACVRVEILPEDVAMLRITDGRTADEWTTAILYDPTDSGNHVRRLAEDSREVVGPLTWTEQTADGSTARVRAPIVVFDGWRRAAAWIAQLRRGAHYAISGNLVVTQHPVPFLGT
jgi:hypothetical protein